MKNVVNLLLSIILLGASSCAGNLVVKRKHRDGYHMNLTACNVKQQEKMSTHSSSLIFVSRERDDEMNNDSNSEGQSLLNVNLDILDIIERKPIYVQGKEIEVVSQVIKQRVVSDGNLEKIINKKKTEERRENTTEEKINRQKRLATKLYLLVFLLSAVVFLLSFVSSPYLLPVFILRFLSLLFLSVASILYFDEMWKIIKSESTIKLKKTKRINWVLAILSIVLVGVVYLSFLYSYFQTALNFGLYF